MKIANPKKPITLKNNTKYFDPNKDKVKVSFSSPESYTFRKNKIEGYENRLYWQFKYCQDIGGQTYFYTLTYNDEHIPHHYGMNCFDYEDLREFLTGGFRKILLRKYSTVFKYFISAELGDGKGERGFHNNPHYHVLFFLQPSPEPFSHRVKELRCVGKYVRNTKYHKIGDPKFKTFYRTEVIPYTKISPDDFRHLIRLFWQGFDEAVDGFHDFRSSKFGIVKEGSIDEGLVQDFRASGYCAKYVCKDVDLKRNEVNVEKSLRMTALNELKDSELVYKAFYHSYIFSNFNIPIDHRSNFWTFSDGDLYDRYFPEDVCSATLDNSIKSYKSVVHAFCTRFNLWKHYQDFLNGLVDEKVKEGLCEYRNRFCNKCRISHGVGDYALEHISDVMNPTVKVPDKKGFKERPIGLYYYRKLFCDVVKDSKGSNFYVLNEKGIKYRTCKLQENIKKKIDSAYSDFRNLCSVPGLYDKMLDSDVNVDVSVSFDNFIRQIDKCNEQKIDFFRRYAEYKLVYENRYFPFDLDGCDIGSDFPVIDVDFDYKRFIKPSFYSVSRSDLRLDSFLESGCKGYLSYDTHPYFLPCLCIFRVLDLCSYYLFVQKDDKLQREAEDISRIKRFHKRRELKQYFDNVVKCGQL